MFPNNHLFCGLVGEIYSDIGDFKKAETYFKKAIKIDPNNEEAIYGYVNFKMGIGDKKSSISFFNKILKINKFHSMSYYSLSRLINIKEDKYIRDKININLDNFKDNYNKYNILFSKSNIWHRLKNYEKSAKYLVEANELKLIEKPSNINDY